MSDNSETATPITHFSGGTLVELSPPALRQADLWTRGDEIIAVGEAPAELGSPTEQIDCTGCLVMSGLICGHGHLYSALATGMPAPAVGPTCFTEILERVWWKLDEALDEASLRASAVAGALSAIRCGTTSIIDHHASPSFIDGSLDVIADALEEVGLRSVLCYEVTDRGGPERAAAGVRENERFIEQGRSFARGLVGGHACFTLSAETLEACVDVARRLSSGLHIHAAEDGADQLDSVEKYGKRVVPRLAEVGAFGPRTLLVHGVHLDDDERAQVAASECWIAHNARSNMNNSVGYSDPAGLGARVILGTDGIGADMFAESQHAFFRGREQRLATDAAVVLGWLARSGDLMSDLFGRRVGRLEPGAAADVTVLEASLNTPMDAAGSLPWHWMFGLSSRMVRDVMTAGRVVLRDRVVTSVDEERLLAFAHEQAEALWSRL